MQPQRSKKSGQQHRAPNRKVVSKVIRDSKLGPSDIDANDDAGDDEESVTSEEENPLHDKLESCTVEELQRLKKSAFQFNEAKYPQHRIEVVTAELVGMNRREPLRFTDPVVMPSAQQIVAKFDAFFTTEPDPRSRQPLLLNIEPQSQLYGKLRQWSQYEVIGDIFDPVHLALFDRGAQRPVAPPTTIDTLARLQNALIVSHRQETTFRTVHLIEQLEHQLYSKLLEIYVNQRTATFVLEWNQSSPFVLVVCFGVVAPSGSGDHVDGSVLMTPDHNTIVLNKETADVLVTLSRDDLLGDVSKDVASPYGANSGGFKKRKKAQQLDEHEQRQQHKTTIDMNQRREFLRACKLSYLYYGYIGRG